MGNCTSNIQSEQINVDQQYPNDTPSNWNQHQVIIWIQSLDLTIKDQSKLTKKFKKYKIDGNKLMQLTAKTLKETLKIKELRLRLEVMKCINKKKSIESYPSPLHINKYSTPPRPLPPYYPFDYTYRVSLDVVQYSQPAPSILNRLSWTIGTIVLIYNSDYDTWFPAQIEHITRSHGWPFGCIDLDYVTVMYELPNGIIARNKLNRFDSTSIKSDQRFMSNRSKLQQNCILEVFDDIHHQWAHSYIRALGSNNKNDFVICNTTRDLRYDRWSPKIRCSEALLNLTINSELHTWNCQLKCYCCAKIIEIYNNNDAKLDIFKVIYKTRHDEYYFKYIHQFSANILLLNNDEERPSHYTDLEVVMYSQSHSPIKHDVTDEMHCGLLLEGWLRRVMLDNEDESVDLVNVLSMLMTKGSYIGYNYGLIMYLESKYW